MSEVNIKSETIDKAIDIIEESTKESRAIIDKKSANGINKLFDLISATPIGIKAEVYIAEREYKLKEAMENMKKKYDKIPEKYRVEPSSYIALKGINELNYCLDEEHLKKMFENILISDMDSRNKSKVLPGYIEIIKQLNKSDAEFLKLLKNSTPNKHGLYMISLFVENKWGFEWVSGNYIVTNWNEIQMNKEYEIEKICNASNIVLDNLIRNRLVEIPNNYNFCFEELYEKIFEYAKKELNRDEIKYKPRVLKITDFGKNFIDICI